MISFENKIIIKNMSKITIVDVNDNIIGSEERDLVTKNKKIRRIVRVIVRNRKNEYLLQFRSASKNIFPLTYDQTVGGHVEEGESYEQAAIRETKEEIGVSVKASELKEIAHFYCEETFNDIFIREWNKLYLLEFDNLDYMANEDEVKQMEWKTEKEIDELFNNNIEKLSGGFRYVWTYLRSNK